MLLVIEKCLIETQRFTVMAPIPAPTLEKRIRKLYANVKQKGALRDPKRFYKVLKKQGKISDAVTYAQLHQILVTDPNYIKFVQTRKRGGPHAPQYQPYTVSNWNQEYCIDLAFVHPPKDRERYKALNGGYKGFLTVVNVFSRYVNAEPIKSKEAAEVQRALTAVFIQNDMVPQTIYSDEEAALKSTSMTAFFEKHNIKLFFSRSLFKAALAERENRFIKTSLARFMYSKDTENWLQFLPSIIKFQNNAFNRIIQFVPAKVNALTAYKVLQNSAGNKVGSKSFPSSFGHWYRKQAYLRGQLSYYRPNKRGQKKDGYFYVGQPVYINIKAVSQVRTKGDPQIPHHTSG